MSYGHAVVIGGSIAGMCAAKAASPFFERVTVIDRDAYPAAVGVRPGAPQARHAHVLLARGSSGLEQLFPGFGARIAARGAMVADVGLDFACLRATGWQERFASGVPMVLASRELTEFAVREMLREAPNVSLLERTEVTALSLAPGGLGQVMGVCVRARSGEGGARSGRGYVLDADLVIDASGRASRAPSWLRDAGAEVPEETVVDAFAGYSSRWYKAPPRDRWPSGWWWKGVWIDVMPPDELTGGILFPVDGDRWIVTVGGYARQYPPSDEAGFTAALRAMRSPAMAEAVALAEPISPVYSSRGFANRFRRYERIASPLGGFVALGDSACVFNPIYGQGMSASVISALILAAVLRETTAGLGSGFSRAFFRAQARALEGVWGMAVGADFSIPGTVGEAPRGRAAFKRYTDAVFDMTRTDPLMLHQVMEVLHLLEPASALFAPSIMRRLARGSLARILKRGLRPLPIPAMPPPLG